VSKCRSKRHQLHTQRMQRGHLLRSKLYRTNQQLFPIPASSVSLVCAAPPTMRFRSSRSSIILRIVFLSKLPSATRRCRFGPAYIIHDHYADCNAFSLWSVFSSNFFTSYRKSVKDSTRPENNGLWRKQTHRQVIPRFLRVYRQYTSILCASWSTMHSIAV